MSSCQICEDQQAREGRIAERSCTAYDCPTCGYYWIDDIAYSDIIARDGGFRNEFSSVRRATLSYLLRHDLEVPQIDTNIPARPRVKLLHSEFLMRLLDGEYSLPSPLEQSRKLLRLIGDLERELGNAVDTEHWFFSEIGAPSAEYVVNYVSEMEKIGWLAGDSYGIQHGNTAGVGGLILTLAGWREWESISKGKNAGNRGFIAMKFGDPSLDSFVNDHLKPGIRKRLEIEIERVDDNPEAGIIDNRMRQLIQDSAFVIADLTHANNGAYWEAGYAEGLGKPVIYMCEQATFAETKTHFDVNHSTTVIWTIDDPNGALDKLAATIANSIRKMAN